MDKINKQDLVVAISDQAHLSKKDARNAVDVVFGVMEQAVLNGQEVNITNFGAFVPKTRQARDGTDPKSHQRIVIKEAKTVSFRLSKALKDKLN